MKSISIGVRYFAMTVSVLVGILTIYHMCDIIKCSDSTMEVPWCHDIRATASLKAINTKTTDSGYKTNRQHDKY